MEKNTNSQAVQPEAAATGEAGTAKSSSSRHRSQNRSRRPRNPAQQPVGQEGVASGETQSQPKTQGQNQPQTQSQSQNRPQSQSRQQGQNQGQTQPQTLAQNRPQGQTQPQTLAQNRSQGQTQPQTLAQNRPQGQTQPQTLAQNRPQGQTQPQTLAQNRPQGQTQPQTLAQNRPQGQRPPVQQPQTPPNGDIQRVDAELVEGDAQQRSRRRRGKKPGTGEGRKTPIRIIPLGGLGEIGKNMTLYECGNDMFIVDVGLSFPDDEMFGVDIVIPDFTFVERNKDKIRGIVITHGHEDHIGGLAYLLKVVNIPVYATRLTLALIEGKLKEHGLLGRAKLNEVKYKDTIKLGCMSVEFIAVNHSIPDACALAIFTPTGTIIQTGDFKVDYTPISGPVIDLARFGELGSKGVLCLLSDSTNVERPGTTPSERTVGDSLDALFKRASKRRIILATFSSNVHRIQQVADACVRYGRKLAVSGRSMINMVTKATELGYLNVPEGLMIDVDLLNRYPDEKVALVTTGSQGEAMSALTRMAMSDHRKVTVTPNDCIIISASAIPGNEKTVSRVVNELMKLGADVIYEKMYDIHVSGHASRDELKLMIGLTRPQFFIPVHGEFRHLKKHASLAASMGVPEKNILIGDIGKVMELDGVDVKFNGTVPAGATMVDGLGVGDVGSIVLRDRKHLAEDGLIIVVVAIDSATGDVVSGPDLVSRGFVYVREAEDMMADAKRICRKALGENVGGTREWGNLKNAVRDQLGQYIYGRTKRSPMILPIIQEV